MTTTTRGATMKATINSRFMHETGEIVRMQYADGSLALCIQPHAEDPGHLERLSINLIDHGLVAPAEHVYVKEYAEHEGLPLALVEAGVAEHLDPLVRVTFGAYDTTAVLMKVLA